MRCDNFLDISNLRFSEKNGILSFEIEGGKSYPWIEVYAIAPLTNPYGILSIRDHFDPDLKEIGRIESLWHLTSQYQVLVKKALDERYFIPHIIKIMDVKDSYTTLVWQVLTDKGPKEILLKDPHEYIRLIGPDIFIFIDIDENRYRIENIKKLDKKSQRLFEKYYYQ